MIAQELALAENYLLQAKQLIAQAAHAASMNRVTAIQYQTTIQGTNEQQLKMAKSLLQESIRRMGNVVAALGGEVVQDKNDGY